MAVKDQDAAYKEALSRIEGCLREKGKVLDLSRLGLKKLPPKIGQLASLKELYLNGNHLSSLPPEIGQLSSLTKLYLIGNQLNSLPREISQLTSLATLDLGNNQVSSMPPEIGQLSSLTELILYKNQLSGMPPEIGQLRSLTRLNLGNNQISSLLPEIGQLTSLTKLYLHDNQLSSLPPEIGQLVSLTEFHLDDNELNSLPHQLKSCVNLSLLFLHDNPKLKLSRAVLGDSYADKSENYASPKSIMDVYFGRMEAKARPLNEVKLLMVGRGNAGKTSTVQALMDLPFNATEESTSGIALCDWTMDDGTTEPVTAHIWDFAGQVITHALHQFFFSERSVYLLVLAGRENHETDDAEYWLRLIMAFGKDTQGNGPPVIVVLNKWDLPGCRPNVDEASLQERYPCIRAFIEMDCETGKGIDELKTRLHREVNGLEWVREMYPANWDKVRNALSPKENKQPHLSYTQFRDLCKQHGVEDKGQQDSLARILHNLGLALNYRNDPRLREATVLQPEWLTANVYALMRQAEKNAGVLTLADVATVLADEKSPEMRSYLMQLMERFEIAYSRNTEQAVWLLPQALPNKQPPDVAELAATSDATKLRYLYETLPEGLLARAIVRLHELIEVVDGVEKQWARGVILCRDNARALLRIDQEKRITLTITGPEKARQELAGLCRAEMRELHASIAGLNPAEETLVQDTWVPMQDFEDDEQRHKETPVRLPDRKIALVDPALINNTFTTPLARSDEWKPSVFISYSKSDYRQRNNLLMELKILRNEGLVAEAWFDHMIVAGDLWHETIQHKLAEADVIVLLVSRYALSTDYITDHEIPFALRLQGEGKTVLVPVILEDCRWTATTLSPLNALPEKGKPLNKWRPASDGWKRVADGLAVVLKGLMKDGKRNGKKSAP